MHSTLDSWHTRFLFPSTVRDGNTFAAVVFPVRFGLTASGIGHNHKMLQYVWKKGEIIKKVIGGLKYKNVLFQGKLNEKIPCTPGNPKNIHALT